MYRLRRVVGIVARTEVEGLSAHFAAGTQVFDRSRAAVSGVLIARLKIRRRAYVADDALGWSKVTALPCPTENQFQLMTARFGD